MAKAEMIQLRLSATQSIDEQDILMRRAMKAFLQILVGLVLGVAAVAVCLNLGLLGNVSSPDWRSGAVTFMLLAATQWASFFSFRRHLALQVLFGVALCMAIAVWLLYSSFPMFWEHESEPQVGVLITWRSSIAFLLLLGATQGISFFLFHWVELIRRRRPTGTGPSKPVS